MSAALSHSYKLSSSVFFIHDKPSEKETLTQAFRDAFQLFQIRVRNLGNLDRRCTLEEIESVHVMLEALVEARGHIDTKVL